MKKIIALLLVVAMTAAASVAGTIAYLQDSDSDVNVMTVGSVYIKQHEYQRAEGVTYNNNGVKASKADKTLVPFVQGQPLLPAVPTPGADDPYTASGTNDMFYWGDYVFTGTSANGLWNDDKLSNVMDKMVFVENTGKSNLYFRTIIALEAPEGMIMGDINNGASIGFNGNSVGQTGGAYVWSTGTPITVDNTRYMMYEALYNASANGLGILKPGQTSHPSLLQVVMDHECTNDDVAKLGDTYEILVVSQAVQADGFTDAETALDEAFGDITATNHPWVDGVEIPVMVSTEAELASALKEGGSVILSDDLTIDADSTITVASGVSSELNLNGHTLTATSDTTGKNANIFDVKGGELTVSGGTIEYKHEGSDMGWNNSTNIFNITAGGVVNLENVVAKNEGGSAMAFVAHLNNWGKATLNVSNSTLESTYIPVRVFNSGYDMNNVTIKDSTLKGKYCFWVHNYIGDLDSSKHSDEAIKARLNFDIFNGTNTFEFNNSHDAAALYGFNQGFYLDENGAEIDTF